MKFAPLTAVAATAFCLTGPLQAAEPQAKPVREAIGSWGDIVLVHGPGTDAAMDTPEAMVNMFTHYKGRGFTGIYLRTDLTNVPPELIVRNPPAGQSNAVLGLLWRIVDDVMAESDPHTAASAASKKVGFEHWMFHPYIYSEGAPPGVGIDGPGRMVPWSYARKYHIDHPEVITVDRAGNKQWMVPEYAYPGARAEKVEEFVYMVKKYKPTGIVASMRSEASQLLPPPEHGDQYGFNKIIVDEMKRLYDVDILVDPRFDYKRPQFKHDDPILNKWRDLRGTYLTQLFREIRAGMKDVDPKVKFAITLSGDHMGPVLGNWRLEWRKWIDEGICDVIVMPVTFEASYDPDSEKKGYLTNTRFGVGMVSAEEVRAYIQKSKHPEIEIINTGATSYFYPPSPPGTNGWQCDIWYDSYTVAIYQRWEQWKNDLKKQGYISFLSQNFDHFPTGKKIHLAEGDRGYIPALHTAPGAWNDLGDGTNSKATIQSDVKHGDTGQAMLIKTEDLREWHLSSPDRSKYAQMLDTAITNGKMHAEFWVYRDSDISNLTIRCTGDVSYEADVAVRIMPKTGKLQCASGTKWLDTDQTVPVKQWHKLSFDVNVDKLTYSAASGEDNKSLCKDVKFAPAKDRFVELAGVNIPIKVPSYRVFNVCYFIPGKEPANQVCLDDVSIRWVPTMHYAPPGTKVLMNENFEKLSVANVTGKHQAAGGTWHTTLPNGGKVMTIENTTSYGEGVKCLRGDGPATFAADLASDGGSVATIDLDYFLRSDKDFPYILPDPATKSNKSFALRMAGGDEKHSVAAIDCQGSTWRLWDGERYVDTAKPVTYDVWAHLQIAIDKSAGTYQLVAQPIGQLPEVVGSAPLGKTPAAKAAMSIELTGTGEPTACFDNIVVTGN